jgi:hypothetical protein
VALVRNEGAELDRYLESVSPGLSKQRVPRGGPLPPEQRESSEGGAAAGDAAGRRADISGHRKISQTQGALHSGSPTES